MKELTRIQMKNVKGGVDGNADCYMCCWTNDMTNCSICVCNITNPTCVSNATLVACGS